MAAGIWGYGALALPVGLLTDSAEPDHAEERYDRAIERVRVPVPRELHGAHPGAHALDR